MKKHFNLEDGINLIDIAALTGGQFISGGDRDPMKPLKAISSDSRKIPNDAVFAAVRGENFDGNDFVNAAFENGAEAALCERCPDAPKGDVIVVENTLAALGKMGRAVRRDIDPLTVAVTGSVGKTTTKEFIHAVLSQKYNTHKTEGNLNTEIGLPFTLFGLTHAHNALVVELGMDHAGEIERLSKIAEPDIAVITNIGHSHIENLGSREGIRDAKLEIIKGLREGGKLVLNGDEPLLAGIEGAIYVGCENPNCDVLIEDIIETEEGSIFNLVLGRTYGYNMRSVAGSRHVDNIEIRTHGKHNVFNAAIAYAVGELAGLSSDEIRAGLLNFKNTGMRQNIYEIKNGVTVIEDCYNASPESMEASLSVLSKVTAGKRKENKKARAVAVLGRMLELGDYSLEGHKRAGRAAARNKADILVVFGNGAEGIIEGAKEEGFDEKNIYFFPDINDPKAPAEKLREILREGDTVLFKASNIIRLARVIELVK